MHFYEEFILLGAICMLFCMERTPLGSPGDHLYAFLRGARFPRDHLYAFLRGAHSPRDHLYTFLRESCFPPEFY